MDKINELIHEAEYLIILDGFEEMQKGEDRGTEFGYVQHGEIKEILTNLAIQGKRTMSYNNTLSSERY